MYLSDIQAHIYYISFNGYGKCGDLMETAAKINSFINGIVWGPFMLCFLLGVGVFFTFKLKFFQLVHFKIWWKETAMSLFKKNDKKQTAGKISSFQAMATALAGAIGTGNIVGVAGAISLGGAGSIFWMWIASFFGMATIFAENVLGIKYRTRKNGKFVGGPMYYIEKGMHCKWLAVIFAVLCTFAALGMGNMTQANSIAGAVENGFNISPHISGIILSVLVCIIIFGGIGRIASITEKLVPVMAVVYTLAAVIVITVNYKNIPSAFQKIFVQAFDINSAAGGFMGYGMARALKYGISRGVFSNEAGLGSSPIVHAAADTDDPSKQGMWGIFQVFVDTIVLCTLMALCILTTDSEKTGLDGIHLSTASFEAVLGSAGTYFMTVSIILFAFATLVSWSYYGERSLEYLTGKKFIVFYRILYALITYVGCIMGISLVWEISDTLNGLMAIPNLIALLFLSRDINYEEIHLKCS